MNKYILTVLYFAFSIVASQAQTLKGTISDETDKTPLVGATIKLANTGINSLSVVSDKKGGFIFQNIASGNYTLSISSIGYEPYQKTVTVSDNITNDLGAITLLKTAKVLNTVTINSIIPPVRQKADTLEYAANAYKVNPDANAEDLVKKMPGVTVDNGTVTAHGETVKKVTVDGREFFGDDKPVFNSWIASAAE